MSLSFFFDMPSAHFNCLSKAFAKRPLGIFWGGDQPTQGYKPFIYIPKGVSHLHVHPMGIPIPHSRQKLGGTSHSIRCHGTGSQAAANGSFGVPVGSEITGKQNCRAGRVIRNDPSARFRGHREWACLGPGGGGRGCPAGGAQLLLSGILGSTVGGQSCFVLGSHVSF